MRSQVADVQHRVFVGLKFDPQAALDAIGQLVILGEAHNGGGQEYAGSQGALGIGILPVDQAVKGVLKGAWKEIRIAKQLGGGVQVIFAGAELAVGRGAAAGGLLAHEQGRGNGSVEQAKTAANHNGAAASQV